MIKTYILLASICFDWSAGEYCTETVDDIYLGSINIDTPELAEEESKKLLKQYIEDCHKTCKMVHDWECYSYVKSI